MKGKNRIYTKEAIELAVLESFSIAEVCRKVGILKPKGGSYQLIQSRIKEYNLDTSHFKGKKVLSGKLNPNYERRKTKEKILVKGYFYRQSHSTLKRALLESDFVYKCNCCGLSEWNGKSITLDVNHINGDWSDCTVNNLEFLCPNCHRQTDTFGSKNMVQ